MVDVGDSLSDVAQFDGELVPQLGEKARLSRTTALALLLVPLLVFSGDFLIVALNGLEGVVGNAIRHEAGCRA